MKPQTYVISQCVYLCVVSFLNVVVSESDSTLKSTEARANWEMAFDDAFIQPVCKVCSKLFLACMHINSW